MVVDVQVTKVWQDIFATDLLYYLPLSETDRSGKQRAEHGVVRSGQREGRP